MSLDRLLGRWSFSMQHIARAHPVAGEQRYERVLDGAFVLLHWTYAHPDFPDAMALLSDARVDYYDVRGERRVFDLTIDDAAGWSMVRRDDDFWQRSSGTFAGVDRMEGSGENSFDRGATWQHDFSITYDRL